MKLIRGIRLFGELSLVLGAIDPLEGSLLILAGSCLLAAADFADQGGKDHFKFRLFATLMIACGVAAIWGLSSLGGFGGESGLSSWWGVTVLPYPVGWSISLWGPGSPRWLRWSGIALGSWYLALAMLARQHIVVVTMALIGLLTVAGCSYALIRDRGRA